MARVKVAIEKGVQFQGSEEKFSNVYTYEGPTTDEPALEALADAVVALEKGIHSANITFKAARVWDVGLIPNYMRVSKALTGTGSATAAAGMYRECAYLIKFPLARKFSLTRTVQRSLKKWLHTNALVFGGDTGGISTTNQPGAGTPARLYLDDINQPVSGWVLVNDDGESPIADAEIAPYMEHRQFPRGRKE